MKEVKDFVCIHCGKCCKMILSLTEYDIHRLEKAGHKDFVEN
jgi:hypothetical protein